VKTKVLDTMRPAIKALPASANWSVIAHSLGTAVTHDALDMLWSGKNEDGTDTGFEPRHEQALLMAMIANVSRVLQSNPKAFDGTVKPGLAGQSGRGCLQFLTCRHKLDPFCIPKMFRPELWPDADSAEKGIYQYVEIEHIHEANVHGLTHYLRNPATHIPVFRKLTFKNAITIDEENAAIAEFRHFGDIGEAAAIKIKQRLEDMAPGISAAWTEYRSLWDQLAAIVAEFR
jgi:hypothetical protein